ncbi:MAG: radical SAM protein [Candidatus Nezhaarchaeota archaeon]|nr:radical SAM protein [Candidatus Nezhaarchaeota archaeon]
MSRRPSYVRASYGTAVALGLSKGWVEVEPTTLYLLTYVEGKCLANCAFCPQARDSLSDASLLSRILWPPYPAGLVVERCLEVVEAGRARRACVQAINNPRAQPQLRWLVAKLSQGGLDSISVSTPPVGLEGLRELRKLGAERVSIALDAASPRVFDATKGASVGGPYTWEGHWRALRRALEVFGRGSVTTHLIVGLGETEREVVEAVVRLSSMGILPALFALTPVPGTRLESASPPSLASYRRIQLARHLIVEGLATLEDFVFSDTGRLAKIKCREAGLREAYSGKPFETSGCPCCNRPFYNERPGTTLYNYPRPLRPSEVELALAALKDVL